MIYDFLLDSKVGQCVQVRVCDEMRAHVESYKLKPWPHCFDAEFVGRKMAGELSHRVAKVASKAALRLTLLQLFAVEPANIQCLGLPLYAFVKDMVVFVSFCQVLKACDSICESNPRRPFGSGRPNSREALRDALVRKLKLLGKQSESISIKAAKYSEFHGLIVSYETPAYIIFVDDFVQELRDAGFAEVKLKWI
jgi:hypothetical protein